MNSTPFARITSLALYLIFIAGSATANAHPGHAPRIAYPNIKAFAKNQKPKTSGQVIAAALVIDLPWQQCQKEIEHFASFSACSFVAPPIEPMITHLDEQNSSLSYDIGDNQVTLMCSLNGLISLQWMGEATVANPEREKQMTAALSHWQQTAQIAGIQYYRHATDPQEVAAAAGTILKSYDGIIKEISLGKVISVMRKMRIDYSACMNNYSEEKHGCDVYSLPALRIDHPGDPGGGEPICQTTAIAADRSVKLCVDAFTSSYTIRHQGINETRATQTADIATAIDKWTPASPFQIPFTVMTSESIIRTAQEKFLLEDTIIGTPIFQYREIIRLEENLCKDNFFSAKYECLVQLSDLPADYYQHVSDGDSNYYRLTESEEYGIEFLNRLDQYRIFFQHFDRTPTKWEDIGQVVENFHDEGASIEAYRIVQPK